MGNIVFFIGIMMNCVLASFSASNGDIAKTIVHSTFILSLVLVELFEK